MDKNKDATLESKIFLVVLCFGMTAIYIGTGIFSYSSGPEDFGAWLFFLLPLHTFVATGLFLAVAVIATLAVTVIIKNIRRKL